MHTIINSLDEKSLHLTWTRHPETGYYTLDFEPPFEASEKKIEYAWKVDLHHNMGYGTCSGNSFRRLRDAKADCMNRIRKDLSKMIDTINGRLRSDTTERICLSPFEYHALSFILDRALAEWSASHLHDELTSLGVFPEPRDTERRFGNALAAFDYDGIIFFLLEHRIRYSINDGMRHIDTDSLSFTVTADYAQYCQEKPAIFDGENLLQVSYPMLALDALHAFWSDILNTIVAYMKTENRTTRLVC